MDYRELIEHDNLTGLDYVDPTIYLNELNKGNIDESTIDINLTRLLSNMTIIDYISDVEHILISLGTWIFFLRDVDNSLIYEDELVEIKNKIKFLLQDYHIFTAIEDSRLKCGFWSYLDISIVDVYNDAFSEEERQNITIEDLLNKTDYLQKLLNSKKGERK